ncbi:MAG: hypothetical protein EBR82_16220 [Caulobacteraceae bacterium]|nr:hypothetical protein [Caulobacteraceae bacterium]
MDNLIVSGKNIDIYLYNMFFMHVAEMLLEHFDTPEWGNTLFLLDGHLHENYEYYQKQFPKKRIIAYQLEQLFGPSGNNNFIDVNKSIEALSTFPEVWDYDRLNIDFLSWYCVPVKHILPMMYARRLDRIQSLQDPKIDVLFYGMLNERRWRIIEQIQRKCYGKLKFAWIYGDADMDAHIANSKIILNLHAFEPWNRQEQVRMFYPIINGKTVVSEPSQINYLKDMIVESGINELPDVLQNLCGSENWKKFGSEARIKFMNMQPFKPTNS